MLNPSQIRKFQEHKSVSEILKENAPKVGKTEPGQPTRQPRPSPNDNPRYRAVPLSLALVILGIVCWAILNLRAEVVQIRREISKPSQQLEVLKLLIEDQRRALQVLASLKERAQVSESAAESRVRDIRQNMDYLSDNMRHTLDDFMAKTGGQMKNYMLFRSTTADYIARLAQQSQGMRDHLD